MAFEHSQLSKIATNMFNDILAEMQKREFKSVSIQLLLWGILNSNTETSSYSELENYFYRLGDYFPSTLDDAIDMLFGDSEEDDDEPDNKKKKKSNKQHAHSSATDSSKRKKSIFQFLGKATDKNKSDSQTTKNITLKGYDENTIKFIADEELQTVLDKLAEIIERFDVKEIEVLHFISALFMSDSTILKKFLRNIDVNYDKAKKYFSPENILVCGIIPFELSGFLSTLNEKVNGKLPCEILGRDKEVEAIWNISHKKNKRNSVLVGKPGVGKTALIEKVAYDIVSGNGPQKFKKHFVVVLDVNALIAGTTHRGESEERIKNLINFLETHDNIILFIDEVHTILGAGSSFKGEMDLSNALKPILARGDTTVVSATTEEEFEKYFQQDGALSRRFEKVPVEEPLVEDVYPMIKNKLSALTQFHGVTISKELVEYSILIANCFAFDKCNPDKTLDLIDRAMVTAIRSGKSFVDKDCILKNFDIFFGMWKQMSPEIRKITAYHEAGHYITGKASGRLVRNNWLAISIMPAETYLGVTVYEIDKRKVPFSNTDYYIDEIAFNLGGRVAESMLTHDFTSGASADLEEATKLAFHLVTKLGMGNDSIKNRVYLNTHNYPMFSEKSVDVINDEVNKVIQKAYDRATELLEENKDILEAIVSALLENQIMSETELDAIWQDVVKKRNQ